MDLYNKDKELFELGGFSESIATILYSQLKIQIRPLDAFHLFQHGKQIPNGGIYLEIGSASGGSLMCVYLAMESINKSATYIAIDPFIPYEEPGQQLHWKKEQFLKNTSRIPCVILINTTSDRAIGIIKNNFVDLLFIDGMHTRGQPKKDIDNYFPKVKLGGILLGHDFKRFHPEVRRAVRQSFTNFKVYNDSSIWMVRKRRHNG